MGLDTTRLNKVLAVMDSQFPGEREAARERVSAMLEADGKTWRDLPAVLGAGTTVPGHVLERTPPTKVNAFHGFDEYMEKEEPGYKARRAVERAREAQEQAAYRAAVVKRYGSKRAALAPTPMERAVDVAVAPFERKEMRTYANGRFSTLTLDGWAQDGDPIPQQVRKAVQAALPLPTTIADAKKEYDAWNERDRELMAIIDDEDCGDTCLSLGCILRRDIVCSLLYFDLRATSLADAIVRHRAVQEHGMMTSGGEVDAMLADLEHLERAQDAPASRGRAGRSNRNR